MPKRVRKLLLHVCKLVCPSSLNTLEQEFAGTAALLMRFVAVWRKVHLESREGHKNHLHTWNMCEEALWALTVIVPSMTHSPIGRSDGKTPTVELATAPVSVFGGLVDNLIKCRIDIVCKLYFSYRSTAK